MSAKSVGEPAGGPQFSVATPTRNALGHLRRCVGSVRAQRPDVAVEHLVQDACSSDGTPEWLRSCPDVRGMSEPDQGMYDAINRAWARSQGEVLSWLNSDEQYLPGTLAFVRDYFVSNPSVDVLFGDYIVCDKTGSPVALRREIPFRPLYVANSFLNAQSCTLFFRRALLERGLLGFDASLRYAADKDLMLSLAARGVRIRHVPRYLSLFVIDGNNLSTHEQMRVEAEQVRLKYGALRSPAMRGAVLVARRVERLLRGAYVSQRVAYQFAVDETPHYRQVSMSGIGGRYSLADAHRT